MLKPLLIATPIALYGVYWVVRAWTGRPIGRSQLNAHTSLLLLCYLLGTAGLGLFWVANQQLPPFDLHYLFGYATLIVVGVHLWLNLRMALRTWRAGAAPRGAVAAAGRPVGTVLAVSAASGVAFFLGLRHGAPRVTIVDGEGSGAPSLQAITSYHELSTHSRLGVIARSPSVDWESAPSAPSTVGGSAVPLPAARTSDLTVSAALRPEAGPSAGPLTLDEVGTVLAHVSGVTERRGGLALRASASSGALFPIELYLVATRVDGLAPGAYRYDPDAHALLRLAIVEGESPPIARSELAPATPADALLVVTAVFQRTGKKYRDRTYRYVVADAGHAVLNAHAASRALGVEAHWARLFDEQRVARALGIDEDREGLLALATLARQPPRVEAPGELFDVPPAFDPAPLGDPSALPLGVTTLAHRATSLRAVVTDRPGGAVGAPVALSPPTASGTTVLDTIRRRRSVRRFSSEPIGSEDFSGVLWESIGARPLFSRAVEAYVIVERVDGVSPGVYRYEAGTHSLVPVSLGSASARAGAAALDQEVVQSAAASIVLASPVAALRAATEGARGYRHALLEAGVRGGAFYLAAGARGLGACSLGAFYDEEARALVGGGDLWALHFVALGVPAAG